MSNFCRRLAYDGLGFNKWSTGGASIMAIRISEPEVCIKKDSLSAQRTPMPQRNPLPGHTGQRGRDSG